MRLLRRSFTPDEHTPVFRAPDRESLLLARSLLDSAGLSYTTVNDWTQDIIDPGRLGTGFNFATGPSTVWVSREDSDAAIEALAGLRSYRPRRVPLWLRVFIIVMMVLNTVLLVLLWRLG